MSCSPSLRSRRLLPILVQSALVLSACLLGGSPALAVPANAPVATAPAVTLPPAPVAKRAFPPAKGPKASAPSAAEVKLLAEAGIVQSDPQFREKGAEFFKKRLEASRPKPKVVTTTVMSIPTAIPTAALQGTTSPKITAFLAAPKPVASARYLTDATAFLKAKGYQAVANGNSLAVTRLAATTPPAGAAAAPAAPVVPPPSILDTWNPADPNGIKLHFYPGDEFALKGFNFTAGSRIILELGVCPNVDLQVLSVTPDGTGIHVKVPANLSSILDTNYGDLQVMTASGGSNTINIIFSPEMAQFVSGTVYVTSWENDSHSTAHASNNGGLGFVEGSTMLTTRGQDRTSCCDDSFFIDNDDSGEDTFGKGVMLVNNYQVWAADVVPTCKDGSHGGGGADGWTPCGAFLTPSSIGMYSNMRKKNAPFDTLVFWAYKGGSSVEYTLKYTMWGPSKMRPITSMPKVGVSTCEQ